MGKNSIYNRSCDVLIIGGGSAGLRAAIEAHDAGANVLIISKSRRGDPHTVLARGGINAALGTMDPKDSWMIHAADTLREGGFLADYEKVELLCKNGPDAVNELVEWGARFHREKDGRLTQRFFGAHTYRRTCFYGDWTGKEIIRVLMKEVRKRRIEIVDNVNITKLLKSFDASGQGGEEKGALGALGIDLNKKKIVEFQSNCVILAAGGYTRVYSPSSSRVFENYGEGACLAYEAGAELIDMEMVQFHPTGMVWPRKALGTLATEAIRGEGGILLNSNGERFMKNYYPERMELGPRDIVARAIFNEIASGRGTKHGGVWLDATNLTKAKILDRLPSMYKQFKQIAGIDISKEKMEVAPTAHYSMGGVKVDNKCETKIKGLFAVGEVAGQVHGANRLGGNSLLGTVVFGKIAGTEAARRARGGVRRRTKQKKITPMKSGIELSANKDQGFVKEFFAAKHPIVFRNEIQGLMQVNAGIVREASKLQRGLKRILELKKEFYSRNNIILKNFKIDQNVVRTCEVKSALVICEAVIKSALMRQESRGAHYRADFPEADKKWKVNIHCRKEGREMAFFKKRVKEGTGTLKDSFKAPVEAEHHLLE
jgi:succinate dehydrogenase / fumarate reductase flavoprotein subunit